MARMVTASKKAQPGGDLRHEEAGQGGFVAVEEFGAAGGQVGVAGIEPQLHLLKQRLERKERPQAVDHARHGGQQFDQVTHRIRQPPGRVLGHEESRGDRQRHTDDQCQRTGEQCPHDQAQRSVLAFYRIPDVGAQKAQPELLDGGPRLLAQQHDAQHEGQGNDQRQADDHGAEDPVAPGTEFGKVRFSGERFIHTWPLKRVARAR